MPPAAPLAALSLLLVYLTPRLAGASSGPAGSIAAVYDLLERLVPGASPSFALSLAPPGAHCAVNASCYVVEDGAGAIAITGSSASEVAAGLGYYLRDRANMTVGWPRGGGSRAVAPAAWPAVGTRVVAARIARFSFALQVCTHSYTLVWYDWSQWEAFIDWMCISGINAFVAYTGQEEVQYRVFSELGVADGDIRGWFNGPAFLTWSRGQNGHGSSIAGPLPRSWMRAQWALQRRILERARALAMTPVLPAFQGNVPWPLAAALGDSNITRMPAFVGPIDTGWVDALDPAWSRIADAWMAALCADFNCMEHVYEMDGFFKNGTTWGRAGHPRRAGPLGSAAETRRDDTVDAPACTWSDAIPNSYLAGCVPGGGPAGNCTGHPSLAAAQAACEPSWACGGVTMEGGRYQARAGGAPIAHANETSWRVTNGGACRAPDAAWLARGRAAFAGITRTDPDGVWLWQGWALDVMGGPSPENKQRLRSFAAAAPAGRFIILDMSITGSPAQWRDFDAGDVPFIWTALYTFGGNDALKGNLSALNEALPWQALGGVAPGLVGTGFTPEGLDQNPAVYDMLTDVAFRASRIPDVTEYLVARAHRRYGLTERVPSVTAAWEALARSSYAVDLGVSDETGVALPHAGLDGRFWASTSQPTPQLCLVWAAWGAMIEAVPALDDAASEPFVYDLVNLGREILAQLSTPAAVRFAAATAAASMDAALVNDTGSAYATLLRDLDALLETDAAFLLGPWLYDARAWGASGDDDCAPPDFPGMSCADFYEFNARAQLTTWYPPPNASRLIARDGDYARKHWAGLVRDYYAVRVDLIRGQALADAAARRPLNATAVAAAEARLAFDFVHATTPYPLQPSPGAVAASAAARVKYAPAFATCTAQLRLT